MSLDNNCQSRGKKNHLQKRSSRSLGMRTCLFFGILFRSTAGTVKKKWQSCFEPGRSSFPSAWGEFRRHPGPRAQLLRGPGSRNGSGLLRRPSASPSGGRFGRRRRIGPCRAESPWSQKRKLVMAYNVVSLDFSPHHFDSILRQSLSSFAVALLCSNINSCILYRVDETFCATKHLYEPGFDSRSLGPGSLVRLSWQTLKGHWVKGFCLLPLIFYTLSN